MFRFLQRRFDVGRENEHYQLIIMFKNRLEADKIRTGAKTEYYDQESSRGGSAAISSK